MLRFRPRTGRAECYGHNPKEKRFYPERGIGKLCRLLRFARSHPPSIENGQFIVWCPQVTFLKKIETAEKKAGILEAQVGRYASFSISCVSVFFPFFLFNLARIG